MLTPYLQTAYPSDALEPERPCVDNTIFVPEQFRKLLWAVFQNAVDSYRHSVDPDVKNDARIWFTADDTDIFSFIFFCEMLNKNPETMLTAINEGLFDDINFVAKRKQNFHARLGP